MAGVTTGLSFYTVHDWGWGPRTGVLAAAIGWMIALGYMWARYHRADLQYTLFDDDGRSGLTCIIDHEYYVPPNRLRRFIETTARELEPDLEEPPLELLQGFQVEATCERPRFKDERCYGLLYPSQRYLWIYGTRLLDEDVMGRKLKIYMVFRAHPDQSRSACTQWLADLDLLEVEDAYRADETPWDLKVRCHRRSQQVP